MTRKDTMNTEREALSKAQVRRLYDNSPEHHGDATSFAGFARIVSLAAAALASKPDAAPEARTGWPAGMLQDDSAELSGWLASKPDARLHAREAAERYWDDVPGSDKHLTLLMAPFHLNLVVGEDRGALLAWGRRVWNAASLEREREIMARAALAAAPVSPPEQPQQVGASASPTGLCGLRPEPQSVSALRAPIPGADMEAS